MNPLILCLLAMASASRAVTLALPSEPYVLKRWAFEYGVTFITSENISEFVSGAGNHHSSQWLDQGKERHPRAGKPGPATC
ncbi:MAG: hypothetical protein Q8Q59_13860 [Luteolibacter sp.]|nr:hypothetical protein [Luteolibacter sp.]